MSKDEKNKLVLLVCTTFIVFLFVLIVKALDNEQPSIEDVMTNNGPTIHDFIEQ